MTRKLMACVMGAILIAGTAGPAYTDAAQGNPSARTEVKVEYTEPSSYVMTIPRDQSTITFGATDTRIGELSVTGNIESDQEVVVTVAHTDFINVSNTEERFAFQLQYNARDFSGATWRYDQFQAETATVYPLTVHIPTETWSSAGAGRYQATLTFQAVIQDVK